MDGIQLYFLPQMSKSLFKIEKTKSVPVLASSLVTTILSMHFFSTFTGFMSNSFCC